MLLLNRITLWSFDLRSSKQTCFFGKTNVMQHFHMLICISAISLCTASLSIVRKTELTTAEINTALPRNAFHNEVRAQYPFFVIAK